MDEHMGVSDVSMKVGISKSLALPARSSLAFVESLTLPLVQEVVISADVRCKECRKRITAVISRMNAETESVVVNVMEKKVTVICKYPKMIAAPQKQITAECKNTLPKFGLLRMIFCSTSSR